MMTRTFTAAAAALGLTIGLMAPGMAQAQQADAAQAAHQIAPRMNDAGGDRTKAALRERVQLHRHAVEGPMYAGTAHGVQQQTRQRTRKHEHGPRGHGDMLPERQRAPATAAGRR